MTKEWWMFAFLRRLKSDKDREALKAELESLREELDTLRSRQDLEPGAFAAFQAERRTEAYQAVFDVDQPLVSVCIATYNRRELVTSRAIASVLAQTYPHLEVVVVGDACTDDTGAAIAALGDPRVRFVNRANRGVYPEAPNLRWMVAGTDPINDALALAKGHFITHLDDDDAFAPNRLEVLLAHIRAARADLLWHPFQYEDPSGKWRTNHAPLFRKTQVTTSSVLYHRWFKDLPWDPEAYLYGEPGDWNRFRKFKFLGVKAERHPEVLLRHFRERNNKA